MTQKACFLFTLLITSFALAQGTRLWKESSYEDFERGTARGVAISSEGTLELAPSFKVIYTSPSTFIWSMASDKDGTVYAATGAPARVYRITPDGKGAVIFTCTGEEDFDGLPIVRHSVGPSDNRLNRGVYARSGD